MIRNATLLRTNLQLNKPTRGSTKTSEDMESCRSGTTRDRDFDFYKSNAEIMLRQGEHTKALQLFTKALEFRPMERMCLVERSKCHLSLGNFHDALTDAEDCLISDGNFYKGVSQKAEVLYMLGDFEAALLLYQHGCRLKYSHECLQGIRKVRLALDRIIPKPDRPMQSKDEIRGKKETEDSQKKSKKLLGKLYTDKLFLEKLLREIEPSDELSSQIHNLAKHGLYYLDTRTHFWRQMEPLHARQRLRIFSAKYESKQKDNQESATDDGPHNQVEKEREEKFHKHTQFIIESLKEIDEEQSSGHYENSLKKGEECMEKVESLSEDELPNKFEMICTLHSCIGNAYLELGNHDDALRHHQEDLRLAEAGYTSMIMSAEQARSRALDNIGRVYARIGRFQDAVNTWETKLSLTESSMEKMWLSHEIGRCLFEMGKHTEANEYGKNALSLAKEAGETLWEINATVLLAQTEVYLGNSETAVELFRNATSLAEAQGDTEAVITLTAAVNELADAMKSQESEKSGSARSRRSKNRELPVSRGSHLSTNL